MLQSAPCEAEAAATIPLKTVPLNAARFSEQSDDVFGRIASRYNLLSDLFSLGIHRHWKRRVARKIASEDWTELLDTASGTGDIVLRVLRNRGASGSRRVVASDTCPQMLNIAGRRLAQMGQHVELRILDAQRMPDVAANSVDLFSISLGLKICDRVAVLREALRVLKPGGRLITLEASDIPVAWLQRAYLRYMRLCMPIIGWIATAGDASAYRYLLRGIEEFPGAEQLAQQIRELGFEEVRFERLSLGIVAIHTARKPR